MATIKINGYDIQFPFEPYPLQKAYMNQVLSCLKNKKNGLLESPTGTGKTVSLLCSSLTWLNSTTFQNEETVDLENFDICDAKGDFKNNNSFENSFKPKIYYSSRTHVQLSQSIKEMKKTNYNNNTAVVLAGRDLLCLNKEVQSLDTISAKNQACLSKIGPRSSCPFYRDHEKRVLNNSDFNSNRVLDIEDLITFGSKHNICPYYASKILEGRSQIVFLPYNYLLDPFIRKTQSIELKNNVVIFDEGHNIEKTCEESTSIDLRSDSLACCIREINTIYKIYQECSDGECYDSKLRDAVQEFSLEDLAFLKTILLDLEIEIDKEAKSIVSKKLNEETKHDNWIFELLSRISLIISNTKRVETICEKLIQFLTSILPEKGPSALIATTSFRSLRNFLSILFPEEISIDYERFKEDLKKNFKFHLQINNLEKENTKNDKNGWFKKKTTQNEVESWILHAWCLSPSVGLKGLLNSNVRNIILTSGTLAPLDSFEVEFDIKFPIRLENQHLIERSQMCIYPISKAYDNTLLNSKFENRNNEDYYKALGNTIVDLCHFIPDGVLVFFSSYSVMTNFFKNLKEKDRRWGIWTKLLSLKCVFEEPKNRHEFTEAITKYKEKVDDKSSGGAILFGVCRGKMSEGLDLGDQYSRGVLLVGLPYPPLKDPKVELKRQHLNRVNNPNLTSTLWYTLQMKRALNQAVGRAVRHKNDFGAVFLLDFRFQNPEHDLSKWCRNFIHKTNNYCEMIKSIESFYKLNQSLNRIKIPYQMREKLNDNSVEKRCEDLSLDIEDEEDNKKQFSSKSNITLDFSLSEYTKQKKINTNKRVFLSPEKKTNNIIATCKQESGSLFDTIFSNEKSIINIEVNTNSNSNENEIQFSNKSNCKRAKLSTDLEECIILEESQNGTNSEQDVINREQNSIIQLFETKWNSYNDKARNLLKTGKNFSSLSSFIRQYKRNKDLKKYSTSVSGLFKKIRNKEKHEIIKVLSEILPHQDRPVYFQYISSL